jgi:uncharacterized membrane protein YjgN (DUF898 family)
MEPIAASWLTFGFYAISVPLIAAARYWMRRYQLSRTRWRGIRMGLAGSGWRFAAASWGWWALQVLSLGWYTPIARMKRARLMWDNTRFGDRPFVFNDENENAHTGLWLPFAFGWFGLIIAIVLAVITVMAISTFMYAQGWLNRPESQDAVAWYGLFAVLAGIGFTALYSYAFWAPYRAAAMNRIAALITLDGAGFRLKARTFSLLLIQLAGWVLIIGSIGLLAPVAGFLQVRYIFNRLELLDAPGFASIGQSIVAVPGAGEGLGDAFDLDMGVGVI